MPGEDKIELRREATKDRLIRYLRGEEHNEDLEALWAKMEFIEDKLRSMKKANVLHIVMKKYKVGRSQAYKLIRECEEFSGQAHKPNAEYLTYVQIERLQRDYELASIKGDFKSAAALAKELRLWLKDPSGQDLQIFEKLKLHQFNITININGEGTEVPLETFYKLRESEQKSLTRHEDPDFASWEEVKEMIDGKAGD